MEQAQVFGFNKDLVLSGPFKNVNLVTKPDKMIKLFGNKYKVTEKETLIGLTKITELENIKILKNNDCKN